MTVGIMSRTNAKIGLTGRPKDRLVGLLLCAEFGLPSPGLVQPRDSRELRRKR